MTRIERCAGCLIGSLLGDVIGAPVEAESAAYLRKAFRNVKEILALDKVEQKRRPGRDLQAAFNLAPR